MIKALLILSVLFTLLILFSLILLFNQRRFLPPDISTKVYCDYPVSVDSFVDILNCPDIFKNAFRITIAYFPELQNSQISIEYGRISSTMYAQPVLNFGIFSKQNRSFKIKVNNNSGRIRCLEFDSLNLSIQVGWLAHEFSHIVDYRQRNFFGLLGFGFNYIVLDSFRKYTERMTDIAVINRGLGKELIEGVEFALSNQTISEDYRKKLSNMYMSVSSLDSFQDKYQQICKAKEFK